MLERQDFIEAMRGVAHSVTVVTTDGPAGMYGATVSAFSSVSADPPTTLVCLNGKSKIAKTVLENGRYTITVLPYTHQHLADRFAGRHDGELKDRFEGLETLQGAPVVPGAAVFECKIDNTVLSGSHHVIIGRVVSCKSGGANPLAYLDGAYCQTAPLPEAEK